MNRIYFVFILILFCIIVTSFRSLQPQISLSILMMVQTSHINTIKAVTDPTPRKIINYSTYLWDLLKHEAENISKEDIRSATLMANSILVQNSLEEAIIDYLAYQLESPLFSATQIRNLFAETLAKNQSISNAWSLDLLATAISDSAMPTTVSAFLFNKGFHALATYRIGNSLWYSGRDGLARHFQSMVSRTFASDIHPACQIGPGCYFSSGSSMVLGETASVGRDCSFAHGVTLGGTGKETGDRHPIVGNGVYFATGATVLGNIHIGDGSVINAGSVVTKPVDSYTHLVVYQLN